MAGQIINRGDRKWLVRVFAGRDATGKRTYHNKTVHGTKKEADAALRQLLTQKDKGQLLTKPKATVDEYLDTWLEVTAAPSVRARTLHDYTLTLQRYVRPHLGKLQLSAVSPLEVRGMLAKLQAKGLSPRTVRKAHEVIRNALEQAVADRLISENPARGRLVKKALPRKEQVERQTITVATVNQFLAAAKQDRLYAYWLVLLYGGLRPSEALALRWSDIQGDAIRVTRVLVDKAGVDLQYAPPKSKKSNRAVVVPQLVLDALKEHKKRQAQEQLLAGPAWRGDGLVFCDEVGQSLRQDRTRRSFAAVLKAAKLPAMRIYDLRHSMATLLLELGEDLKVVSERLGHSTLALTADVYSHVTRGMQERAASRLERLTGTA